MFPETWNREALGLVPWLVGSWLLAFLGQLLDRLGLLPHRWREEGALIRDVTALLYAIGMPYAAILCGFLAPERLGLAGFSWWRSLGRVPLLAGLYLLMAWLVWGGVLRAAPVSLGALGRERRWVRQPGRWVLFLLWAGAEQLHWAFYRAVPLLVWGSPAGLWLGMLLVVAERYGLPAKAISHREPGVLANETWWLTKAVALTAAFSVTGNLWACMALQALLDGGVAWWIERRERPVGEMQPSPFARPGLRLTIAAAVSAILLLVLFTWGTISPSLHLPRPEDLVQQPTLPLPTPTSSPTPNPTPLPTRVPTATSLPTAAPIPTATPPRTYVVQPGDTLNAIALLFDVPVAELMQVNGITDPTRLQIGQVLIIP